MSKKRRTGLILKKATRIGFKVASIAIVIGSSGVAPAGAVDPTDAAKGVLGTEGGKEALNQALKFSKTTPALSIATAITCLACVPAAGAGASAGLCIACGILIAKTFG